MHPRTDIEGLISSIRTRLCTRSPFFGSLALFARVHITDRFPTAATDGRAIYINPDFFTPLTTEEQEGVFIHEVLHAALLHVPRGQGRDPTRWNIAADIVVNGILMREGYTLPQGSIRQPGLEYYSVEEVYDLLEHNTALLAQCQLALCDLLTKAPTGFPMQTSAPMSVEHQRDLEAYWRNAREQASIVSETSLYGSLPAHLQRELGSVKAAQLNWRHYLWRYLVQTPVDFNGFDRRFIGQRLYLDSLEGETLRVIVAVDTSGSISTEQARSLLGEVMSILQAYPHITCDLFFADADVYGPHRLTTHSALPEVMGGGGTDFRPFFERIQRDYDISSPLVSVYLTDGYGEFPEIPPRFPVLWVVTPGGLDARHFPFGEVVRLV